MQLQLIKDKISKEEIKVIADNSFGDMFKIAVDIKKNILAAGGEFHADGEQLLLKDGSKQENIWGANFYPFNDKRKRIEYSALINIRPQAGNKSMNIEDPLIRKNIKQIVETLLLREDDEIS